MTFSKHLPVLCAIAAGAICLTARADDPDNAAQSAARIAIAKALFAQQSSNSPALSTDTNAVMQPVNSQDAKAKAKADEEAAEAKAKQDAAQAEADKMARAEADKKAAADAKAAAAQQEAQVQADKAAASTNTDPNVAAEKAAIAAAMQQPNTNTPAPAQNTMPPMTNSWASATANDSQPVATAKKEKKKKEKMVEQTVTNAVPVVVPQAGSDLGMKPLVAPPLPISATKQERLDALLQKYKADQVTPDEYHSQRAAILAEP
jgi:hypothetical protein